MREHHYKIAGLDLFAPRTDALSVGEILQLTDLLAQLRHPDAASFESMDGLFCALIASQKPVRTATCLSVVLGADRDVGDTLDDRLDTGTLMKLIVGHWDHVAADFECKGLHLPQVAPARCGEVPGRAWARGFMRGVQLAPEGWEDLFGDEDEGHLLVIPLVAGEMDGDWPPAPLDNAAQDSIVNSLAVGAARSYRNFKWRSG